MFDRRRVLQHLKSVHKITGDTAPCIIRVYVENDEFIPPGDAILPRIGTPEENTALIQKEKEWEHQVHEAKALASTASSSLSARRELEELMEMCNLFF